MKWLPHPSPQQTTDDLRLFADTLELKTETDRYSQNAHSNFILSVSFNKDGDKIVSGGEDQTLKVWDVANPRPHNEAEWEEFDGETTGPIYAREKLKWRNKATGHQQVNRPSGVGESLV